MNPPPTVAFFGTGGYLLFSLGVAKFLKERYGLEQATAVTSSGGAVAAISLLTLDVSEFDDLAERIATKMGKLHRDPLAWFKLGKTYREVLAMVVTPEVLPLLRNRLQIATTVLPWFKKKIYSEPFHSVQEIILHLQASAYIPGYFPQLPSWCHLADVDAGLTMHTADYTGSVIVSPKYKTGVDIHLPIQKEKLSVLKAFPYEKLMEIYETGYERAKQEVVKLDVKLMK